MKSRSFHRQFLPLAAGGFGVRYVSPARPAGLYENVNFVPLREYKSRLARFIRGAFLLRTLLSQHACIYHFQDPELFPAAFLLKLLFRKRVVYDAYEDFPSMALGKPSIPGWLRPAAAGFVRSLETFAAYCFDGVMTADPFTLRRLARTGKSRKLVFYNFPNLDFFPDPVSRLKSFDIVYRGGLSERAGTSLLLNAVHQLAERGHPARLLLIGYFDNEASEESFRTRIRALSLESSIEIQGRIAHEQMAAALGQARIGVSPLCATSKFVLNIPVKIFEYWACGLPVIASDLPPIRPFFRNARAGLLFPPGNAQELARAIRWMLTHPREAEQMGRQGRSSVVERFNNRNETVKLRRFCLSLASLP